jgi:molybdate/tungstate transport system substrate-binding protein
VAKAYKNEHPRALLRLEAAGSRHSARKISELGRRADVFGSADHVVVTDLLVPRFARWNIHFATNSLILAYGPRSRRRDEVSSSNWHRILADPEVRFGRADPDSDPCGYRTLMMFQLAERHLGEPGLAARLGAKHGRTFIRPKETDLLALLEAGEIDYLPIYRSVALQHGLSFVTLPPEIHLGDPAMAEAYSAARVTVSGKTPGSTTTLRGEPILYSVTIPLNAPNPTGAEAFVAFLLSAKGRAIFERQGQPPVWPLRATGREALPPGLARLLGPAAASGVGSMAPSSSANHPAAPAKVGGEAAQ